MASIARRFSLAPNVGPKRRRDQSRQRTAGARCTDLNTNRSLCLSGAGRDSDDPFKLHKSLGAVFDGCPDDPRGWVGLPVLWEFRCTPGGILFAPGVPERKGHNGSHTPTSRRRARLAHTTGSTKNFDAERYVIKRLRREGNVIDVDSPSSFRRLTISTPSAGLCLRRSRSRRKSKS